MHIKDSEIEEALSIEHFVASCNEAFRLYGMGEIRNPPRKESIIREGETDLFQLEMSADWPGRYRARKVIREQSTIKTGRLGIRSAVIELEDIERKKRVTLDAEVITNMRTGAAGALGIKYLAVENPRIVSVLGTGRVARSLVLCVDETLKPLVIRCTSRNPKNRDAFEAALKPVLNCELEMESSISACVDQAVAVLTAVPTSTPILYSADVKPTVGLSVIGGDSRTSQISIDLLRDRPVVVDHLNQALRSGEFISADDADISVCYVKDKAGVVQNIGDAALGKLSELRGMGAIAYFTGLAIQDLHVAVRAYEVIAGHR